MRSGDNWLKCPMLAYRVPAITRLSHTGVITTRKRSLGQGNMFTGVCLSTGVVPAPRGVPGPGRVPAPRGVPGPGGHLVRGVPAPGGLVPGVPGGDPPRWPLLRAVRILLECILVCFATGQHCQLCVHYKMLGSVKSEADPGFSRGGRQTIVRSKFPANCL